eukprot:TRINITY_DN6602_c0_g2_i1.p1 TRINITY_DN6602_c0_g2~~TRINITY_DN6602_c0_g2_i1.p1  ORF type:complete len:270 (+),score=44.74 TRINITY_DN6602_c0_g2_i1:108-917(+)
MCIDNIFEDHNLVMEQVNVMKRIGFGSMGSIDLVMMKRTGAQMALKTISKAGTEFKPEHVKWEVEAGKILRNNKGVVAPTEYWEDEQNVYLLMNYVSGTDLISLLESRGGPIPESMARDLGKQLFEIILSVHSKEVAHRDIKLDNIMLDSAGNLRLIDFGLSKIKAHRSSERVGSLDYCAPEIYLTEYDGYKSDVWSAGVLLYCLLFGRFPYTIDDYGLMVHNNLQLPLVFPPSKVTMGARSLLNGMLQPNPEHRISMTMVLQHPWLKQ